MINFPQVRPKWLRMGYDANKWHILHNMAFNRPVWSLVGNGGQLWSRISSLNELDYFKAELRNLGLIYLVMECRVLWEKIGQIWSKVAYNVPTIVIVPRYDRLGAYLSLHYLFWAILALSVRFDYIIVKVPGERESGQKWSIIIYNQMTCYSEVWPIMVIFDTA